jgi:hypothetical protein
MEPRSRRAPGLVRALKAGVTAALAVAAIGVSLSQAVAEPGQPAPDGPDSVRVAERDPRCTDAQGQAIVRGPGGVVKPVAFEYGWKVYQGKRPGTLLVVCPD